MVSLFRKVKQVEISMVGLRSEYRNYMLCFQNLGSSCVTALSSYFALCVTIQRIFPPSLFTGIHLGTPWVFKNILF